MYRFITTALVSILVLLILPLSSGAAFLQETAAPVGQQPAAQRKAAEKPSGNPAQNAQRKEDELLVRFKAGTPAAVKDSLHGRHGSTRIKDLKALNVDHLKLAKGLSVEDAVKLYQSDANVEYAEPNYLVQAASTTPNDSYYGSSGSWGQSFQDMWGLYKLQAGNAWDITQGSSSIVVAVTDTGLDFTHPDIQGKIWSNTVEASGKAGRDDDHNGYVDDVNGWNFYAGTNSPTDDHGHGTHVSGTIAAATNNGAGIAGISWNTKIMPLKFLGPTGSGDVSNGATAIIYAADKGARVVNCSWGSSVYSQTLADAVNYAYGKGVLVVAAAGNSGIDASAYYPAALPHVFTVAATDYQDKRASFSNYGPVVEVAAPGVDILSLRAAGTDMYGDGTHIVGTSYYRANGTSMAAPHASGVAALILAQHPDWTPDQVMAQMAGTADDIGDPLVGGGRLNAFAALTQTAAPRIQVTGHRFDDSTGGNGNGRLDAGETVAVSLTLQNSGALAQGVTISLAISDPFVTVGTGTVSAADLAFGASESTASVPFTITLSPDMPPHHQVVLNFTITANGGTYSHTATIGETASLYLSGGWPLALNAPATSQPVLADLDGDGVPEVVVVTDRVEVRKGDGTALPGWPQLLSSDEVTGAVQTVAAVGDLDHDGHPEIVVATLKGIHAWHADGTPVAGFPVYPTSTSNFLAELNSLVLADLEGDQGLDIIATSPTFQKVYAYRRDGTTLPGWPQPLPGGVNSAGDSAFWYFGMLPAVGDIDGDGLPEVVVPAMDKNVYAWRRDGTAVPGWPITMPYVPLTVSLADLNRDGRDEIFFNSSIGYLYGYNGAGASLAGWPQVCGAASFADFDGNGNLEIACSDTSLQILHADGTLLSGWPQQHGNYNNAPPTVGDLDGDGKPDLIIRDRLDQIYAWNATGNLLPGFPVPLNGTAQSSGGALQSSVALGDINGDGTLDAVSASGANDSNLYALRLAGAGRPDSAQWPMYQGNARRTGEAARVMVITSQLAAGTVGIPYSQSVTAGVGNAPFTWSVSSGTLPTGLSLAGSGTLSGTPTAAGSFTFSLQVQDAAGDRASRQFTVAIAQITMNTSTLPSAQVGVSYSVTASAAGGQLPYSWSVVSGSLPPGVNLDSATGLIHGTPGAAGDFPLTVQVRDSQGATASRALDLHVYGWLAGKDTGGNDYARAVTTDAQGNYFVTGDTDGAFTVRTSKYSPAGAELWTKTYMARWGKGITTDAGGNVYVAGTAVDTTWDCLLLKYDPAGNLLWSKTFNGSGRNSYCNAVAIGPDGSIYAGGSIDRPAPDYRNLFLTIKFDASGNEIWHSINDPGTPTMSSTSVAGIAVDASGNAYVTGAMPTYGPVTGSLTIKYDPSGNQLWSAPWTGSAQGIAADKDGNVVVGGYISDDYRTMPMVLKYSPSGSVLWSRESPDYLPYQYVTGVAMGADGSPYLAGYYSNGSNMDFFAMRYDSAGNFLWGTRYDGGRDEYARGIAVTAGGIAYVTGEASNGTNYDFLTIRLAPPAITTAEPAMGKPQAAYTQTFAATGGALPYTWTVSSGQLPPGLALDPASGTLTGVPSTSGSYNFTVRVAGSDSLTSEKSFTLIVDELASAGFSGTPRVGYAPLMVSFSDTSPSGPTSWNWTFGDGGTSAAAAPSHLYTAAGNYSVSLTDSNGTSGVTTLKDAYISVLACPNSLARVASLSAVAFSGISAGYASAADGDQIQLQAQPFAENVIFNRNIRVGILGGYDCGFTGSIADTPVTGILRIQSGTVDIEKLRLR